MQVEQSFILDPSLVLYLPFHKPDGASFKSLDAYGHLCTVTGALWKPDGRLFDGNDDVITLPSSVSEHSAAGDVPISFGCWAKFTSGDTDGALMSKGTANKYEWILEQTTLANGALRVRLFNPTASASVGRQITDISSYAGLWKCIFCTYSGDELSGGWKIFVNGVQADDDDSDSGAYTGSTDNGEPVRIGKVWDTGTTFDGTIGEVWIYSRALIPLEVQRNYIATKWRYR